MPARFYMTVEGEVSGKIDGECQRKGFEKTIECLAFNHEVLSPRDPHTGQSTGHRMHKLLTITKEFDLASPLLFQALVKNEKLTAVEMKFYRPSTSGVEQHYFTVKLTNAFVASVKPWIPNVLDPEKKSFTNMEDVSFVYSKIDWTHEVGGKAAEDDWFTAS
jgi:type VI secretion system secreted protein Hcp